ncbi:hypothetical protein MTQ17_09920 [Corynebacterium bovis]|uniref:hypothetical protein n=1 Tax=Corynebacterium bovis TaxID=36808 RepID=UPI00313900D1
MTARNAPPVWQVAAGRQSQQLYLRRHLQHLRHLAARRERHTAGHVRHVQAQWTPPHRPAIDRTAVESARTDQYRLDQARLLDERAYQHHQADLQASRAYDQGFRDAADRVATQPAPKTYDIAGPVVAAAALGSATAVTAPAAHDLAAAKSPACAPQAYDVIPSTDITDLHTGINTVELNPTPTPDAGLSSPAPGLDDTAALGIDA